MGLLVLDSFSGVKVVGFDLLALQNALRTKRIADDPVVIKGIMTVGDEILVFYKLIPPAPVYAA